MLLSSFLEDASSNLCYIRKCLLGESARECKQGYRHSKSFSTSEVRCVELASLNATFLKEEENKPKLLQMTISQEAVYAPKSRDVPDPTPRDIPDMPCQENQQKEAPCIRFLCRTSQNLGPCCPRNILPKSLIFRLSSFAFLAKCPT